MTPPQASRRYMNCVAIVLALSLLYGCGGVTREKTSSSVSPAVRAPASADQVSVTVSPHAADVRVGDTVQFSAIVSGLRSGLKSRPTRGVPRRRRRQPETHNTPGAQVVWSINGIPGGNASLGTVNDRGLYLSPTTLPSSNTLEVSAVSVADPTATQSALLTLYQPIPTVTAVTPKVVRVGAFTLTVNGQHFVQGAKVLFANTPLPTTFHSATRLIATGLAEPAEVGNAAIQVSNPEPGSANSPTQLVVTVTSEPEPPIPTPPPSPSPTTSAFWNPSVLGVPWGVDFATIAANQINVMTDPRLKPPATGDGNTDDTRAIRAAIQLAASKGGTVYFPRGKYKIVTPSDSDHGQPLLIPSRIILRGDGPSLSVIYMNDPHADSETDWIQQWGGISFQGASRSGITDLGVVAVNPSNSACALLWNRGSSGVSELFFNNVDFQMNNSRNFWIEGADRVLIQNSHFDSNAPKFGPIYVVGNTNVSFVGNELTYNYGRVQMQNNTHLVMQHNTLRRDAKNKDLEEHTAIESGGVELSFGEDLQVLDNTIQTVNALARESGDGEAIMTQQSTVMNVLDVGSVTSVTSTTLSDDKALWGRDTVSRLAKFSGQVVAILTGPATGQWRTIKGVDVNSKTLTLDQSWDTIPEEGSLFSIFKWTLKDANIQRNTLIDNPNGIVIWDGCNNCIVQNNTLTNSRGIILRAVDRAADRSLYPEGRREHQMAMNAKLLNNTISNTSGVRPAYLALDIEAFARDNYRGAGMIDVELSGNTISPYPGNPNRSYGAIEMSQDGFFPCFFFGPARDKDPLTTVFRDIHSSNNTQTSPVTYSSYYSQFTTDACVSR